MGYLFKNALFTKIRVVYLKENLNHKHTYMAYVNICFSKYFFASSFFIPWRVTT